MLMYIRTWCVVMCFCMSRCMCACTRIVATCLLMRELLSAVRQNLRGCSQCGCAFYCCLEHERLHRAAHVWLCAQLQPGPTEVRRAVMSHDIG